MSGRAPRISRTRRRILAALPFLLIRPVRATVAAPHATYVARAFANRDRAIALGDQPYGAVVVCDDGAVADGISAVIVRGDPTAHAEMQALREAMRALGRRDLAGCVLYGTSPACAMCEAAAAQANVSRLYHGHDARGGGPPRRR